MRHSLQMMYLYIRHAFEIVNFEEDLADEDAGDVSGTEGVPFRVAVCMLRQASHQLLKSQYLQSDIAFKRVVGF